MRRLNRYLSMQDGLRRKVWIAMVGQHLLRLRHRATTILISPPSCAGRRREVCYSLGNKKGPGSGEPGPLF